MRCGIEHSGTIEMVWRCLMLTVYVVFAALQGQLGHHGNANKGFGNSTLSVES